MSASGTAAPIFRYTCGIGRPRNLPRDRLAHADWLPLPRCKVASGNVAAPETIDHNELITVSNFARKLLPHHLYQQHYVCCENSLLSDTFDRMMWLFSVDLIFCRQVANLGKLMKKTVSTTEDRRGGWTCVRPNLIRDYICLPARVVI